MGLPNIERNSDRLRVTSTVGDGHARELHHRAAPRPPPSAAPAVVARRASPSCAGTAATAWSPAPPPPSACATAGRRSSTTCASTARRASPPAPPARSRCWTPPPSCSGERTACSPCRRRCSPASTATPRRTVLDEAAALGFATVAAAHGYETALRAAVHALRRRRGGAQPVHLPRLPRRRQSHRAQVPVAASAPRAARLAVGGAAARPGRAGRHLRRVVPEPARDAARPASPRRSVTSSRRGSPRDALLPLTAGAPQARAAPRAPRHGRRRRRRRTTLLVVTGVAHVLAVLERIEDGLLADVAVVEPYVCDGGCFGSPLLRRGRQRRGLALGGGAGRPPAIVRARPRSALPAASRHPPRRRHGRGHRQAGRAGRRAVAPCPGATAAPAARPPAPPWPRTSSWGAPRAPLPVCDARGGERVMKLEDIARELGLTELTAPAA